MCRQDLRSWMTECLSLEMGQKSNLVAEVIIYWCPLSTFHAGSQFCFWKEDDWLCLFKTWLHRTDRLWVWAFLRTTFSTKMNDWMKSLGTQKQRPNSKIKLHPAIFLRPSLSFRPLNWLNCWNCLKIWTKMTSLLVIVFYSLNDSNLFPEHVIHY